MKEFMLLIRNKLDHQNAWTSAVHQEFLKACELYIGGLKSSGKLIAAQPLIREGVVIFGASGSLKEKPLGEKEDVQVGYYHILAENMEEAISIAKNNPEFSYGETASIEVRPIKTREKDTGFVYPVK